MQPSGEAVPWVVQLTGLTGLEGTFGQWYVSVGRVGFSDKAAMHRRRHAASVVSHGFAAVDAYQRVEIVLTGGLLKCGGAPSVDEMEYHIQINISSHHFYKQRNISKANPRLAIIHHHNNNDRPSTTTHTMSSQTVLKRNNSSSSTHSEGSSNPHARNSNDSAVKRRSSDNKGQGSFMHYGRHSNQWLFEPLKETVTSFFGRKDSS